MERILSNNETWTLSETTALSRLTIPEGAVIAPPEGKLLTLTVDGVHRDLAPGDYTGNVVLSVTDPIVFAYENHGQMEEFRMNAAVSIRDGRYLPLQDDIASVAYWYQTLPTQPFPILGDKDALEVEFNKLENVGKNLQFGH